MTTVQYQYDESGKICAEFQYKDGKISAEFYYKNGGVLHNNNGPAIVYYHQNTDGVKCQQYFINGRLNNCLKHKPIIYFDTDGNIVGEYN